MNGVVGFQFLSLVLPLKLRRRMPGRRDKQQSFSNEYKKTSFFFTLLVISLLFLIFHSFLVVGSFHEYVPHRSHMARYALKMCVRRFFFSLQLYKLCFWICVFFFVVSCSSLQKNCVCKTVCVREHIFFPFKCFQLYSFLFVVRLLYVFRIRRQSIIFSICSVLGSSCVHVSFSPYPLSHPNVYFSCFIVEFFFLLSIRSNSFFLSFGVLLVCSFLCV